MMPGKYAPADLGIKAKQGISDRRAADQYAPADLGIKAKPELHSGETERQYAPADLGIKAKRSHKHLPHAS